MIEECVSKAKLAGIIGGIGCTSPLADNERKTLRAVARAQLRTGAPMTIHPARNPNPDIAGSLEVIAILSKAGADLTHTIMCHIDRTRRDAEQRHSGRESQTLALLQTVL